MSSPAFQARAQTRNKLFRGNAEFRRYVLGKGCSWTLDEIMRCEPGARVPCHEEVGADRLEVTQDRWLLIRRGTHDRLIIRWGTAQVLMIWQGVPKWTVRGNDGVLVVSRYTSISGSWSQHVASLGEQVFAEAVDAFYDFQGSPCRWSPICAIGTHWWGTLFIFIDCFSSLLILWRRDAAIIHSCEDWRRI